MKREITINKDQIEITARWIYANNTYLWKRPDVSVDTLIADIKRSIRRVVECAEKNWELNYSGTAGFTVFFMPEDEKYGVIDILVDPAVSQESDYVDVEDVI